MKKKICSLAVVAAMTAAMTSGCGGGTNDTDYSSTDAEQTVAEMSTNADGVGSYLITNVYGDGQKPWILVLDYGVEIDPDSVSPEDYDVEDYDIESVYVSTTTDIPKESISGRYVLIELSVDYTTSNYTTSGSTGGGGLSDSADAYGSENDDVYGGSDNDLSNVLVLADVSEEETTDKPFRSGNKGSSGGSGSDGVYGGGRGTSSSSETSNQLTVTWTQTGEVKASDGTVFEASSSSTTTDYEENDNLLVKNFEQYTFTAEDGTSMMYSLYVPEDADNKEYPLVLFMPDATGEGSDTYLALTESLGGVIWTTEENQAENPCIVLVPQYETDNTSDPAYTYELLQHVLDELSVDEDRIYLVGQSSGTIRSISLMIDYPDTFAGAMLVAGQPDSDYEDKLFNLADQNIWMICSAGDERAYPGMTSIVEAVQDAGTKVTTGGWAADLDDEEQEENALEMLEGDTTIYFTVFDEGTVMEDDVPVSTVTEHMNTWRVAYDLDTIRDWLLEQTRD